MLTTSDFKKGARIEIDGQPWQILDTTSQSPTARGGGTLFKTKIRNLITGQFLQKTFKGGEKFNEPDLELRDSQFLYHDGDHYHFMDLTSYEQYAMTADETGEAKDYLIAELQVQVQTFNGQPIGVEVPSTMVLMITECEPAVRGDTVNAVTKAATLETGLVVQVPMFVENETKIRVDTREGRYLERAK